MMVEYSFHIRLAGDTEYEAEQNRVHCSSHSVNLGSQKFMRTYSKAPHYDPLNPDAHIPTDRDEVGSLDICDGCFVGEYCFKLLVFGSSWFWLSWGFLEGR